MKLKFSLPFLMSVLLCLKFRQNPQFLSFSKFQTNLRETYLKPFKIGNLEIANNIILAPLAGITNLPFRILCRRRGAAFAFTEMVSVNGLVREGAKTFALLKSSQEDAPLGIQLFGDSAESLAEAARMVESYGELLDINMGCPVKKVICTGAGSALLRDSKKIADIIRAVRAATARPLTIKIRSGWQAGDDSYLEIGKIAESEGCNAITLHPRSRSEMFSGSADWNKIALLKHHLTIPVIGSGDLFTADDCKRMLTETGCDAVMLARGALGNPWIFSQFVDDSAGQARKNIGRNERADVIQEHLELFTAACGAVVAVREMKKHIGWYARGFAGAADIRREVNSVSNLEQLIKVIDKIKAV